MTKEEHSIQAINLKKPQDSTKPLSEFRIGEKFLDWTGLVQILLMYEEDPINSTVQYATKEWKTGIIRTISTCITGISPMAFYPYKGRDKQSFYAGFRFAINLCMKHMTTEQKLDAGIYRYRDDHLMMLKAYSGWKQNNVSFYDRKDINYYGRKGIGNKPVKRKGRLYLQPSNSVSVP